MSAQHHPVDQDFHHRLWFSYSVFFLAFSSCLNISIAKFLSWDNIFFCLLYYYRKPVHCESTFIPYVDGSKYLSLSNSSLTFSCNCLLHQSKLLTFKNLVPHLHQTNSSLLYHFFLMTLPFSPLCEVEWILLSCL